MFANYQNNIDENQVENFQLGIISSVDYANASAIVNLGEIETPPLKWAELTGHVKTWLPPLAGEQVLVFAPNGDYANAIIARGIYFDANPPIGNDENPKIKIGQATISINYSTGNIEITAPQITLNSDLIINGKIDATGDVKSAGISLQNHKHGLVKTGIDKSGVPQ